MKTRNILIITTLLWFLILGGIIGAKQYIIATGTEVLLETQPVDPRDFFRGDYVILSYKISNIDNASRDLIPGQTIYVELDQSGKYSTIKQIHTDKPAEGLFIKGRVQYGFNDNLRVEYGIESYFVPEGEGRALESGENIEVKVLIDKYGNAIINELYLNNEPVRFQ